MNSYNLNPPKTSFAFGSETMMYLAGLFVLAFIVIYVYYTTVGYTINFGWNKVFFMFEKKEPIDITLSSDNEPISSVTLEPVPKIPDAPPGSAHANLPFNPDERPSGMPGAQQNNDFGLNNIITSIEKNLEKKGDVFNISRNIYKYEDAAPLCKAMGAELATYDQVLEAYKNGADWCNYGWVKGQMAVYPTQEKTWQKINKGPPEYRFSCGKPGVNGGFFDNPDLTFGVNCFGKRPLQNDADDLQNSPEFIMPPTVEQIEFDKKVQLFREELGNITVLPFNRKKWSE
jgi:hypothetical protein